MLVNDLLLQRNMTKYRLSKASGIPYATISDICSGKADIRKCSVETVYRIAEALNISLDQLLEPYFEQRPDFELYKSNVCHRLKSSGDIVFISETLRSKDIDKYYERAWYQECFYLLAMLDYISNENGVPLCNEYDHIRNCKLDHIIFPSSVIAACLVEGNDRAKAKALEGAIPEFLNFNIVENEVRNVI